MAITYEQWVARFADECEIETRLIECENDLQVQVIDNKKRQAAQQALCEIVGLLITSHRRNKVADESKLTQRIASTAKSLETVLTAAFADRNKNVVRERTTRFARARTESEIMRDLENDAQFSSLGRIFHTIHTMRSRPELIASNEARFEKLLAATIELMKWLQIAPPLPGTTSLVLIDGYGLSSKEYTYVRILELYQMLHGEPPPPGVLRPWTQLVLCIYNLAGMACSPSNAEKMLSRAQSAMRTRDKNREFVDEMRSDPDAYEEKIRAKVRREIEQEQNVSPLRSNTKLH